MSRTRKNHTAAAVLDAPFSLADVPERILGRAHRGAWLRGRRDREAGKPFRSNPYRHPISDGTKRRPVTFRDGLANAWEKGWGSLDAKE